DAPPDGLPFEVGYNDDNLPVGTNQTSLTLYSPLELNTLTNNGQPYGSADEREFGYSKYTAYVDLPPQSTTTLVFTLSGPSHPTNASRLRIEPQPLVNDDAVHVTITGTDGWKPVHQPKWDVAGTTASATLDASTPVDVTLGFR